MSSFVRSMWHEYCYYKWDEHTYHEQTTSAKPPVFGCSTWYNTWYNMVSGDHLTHLTGTIHWGVNDIRGMGFWDFCDSEKWAKQIVAEMNHGDSIDKKENQ